MNNTPIAPMEAAPPKSPLKRQVTIISTQGGHRQPRAFRPSVDISDDDIGKSKDDVERCMFINIDIT